jgi:hypothetical protein
MKIRLSQFRRLVREEVTRVLSEARRAPADAPSATCPYVASARPKELAAFVEFQGRPELLALKIVDGGPFVSRSILPALCCMTDSYTETRQYLEAAGASREEAEDLMRNGAPGDEQYVYKKLKPWLEYFARGDKCQHAGGHV